MSFPIEAYRDHLAAGKTHSEAVRLAREECDLRRANAGKQPQQRDPNKAPPNYRVK